MTINRRNAFHYAARVPDLKLMSALLKQFDKLMVKPEVILNIKDHDENMTPLELAMLTDN